jgi:hypothetical protein
MRYFIPSLIFIFSISCAIPVRHDDHQQADTLKKTDSADISAPPAPAMISLPGDFKSYDLPKEVVKGKVMCGKGALVYTAGLDDNEGARDEIVIQTYDTGMMMDMYSTQYDMEKCLKRVRNSMFIPLRSLISNDGHLAIFTRAGAIDRNKESYDFILLMEKNGQRWHIQPSDTEDYTKEEIELLIAVAKSVTLE